MNTKETAELRRQFKKNNKDFFISRIAAAYIANENNSSVLKTFSIQTFDELSESEQNIYLAMFKKVLTGKPGRQLTEYRLEAGSLFQQELYDLNQDQLKNEEMVKAFIDKFARQTSYLPGYYITLASCQYQVPALDGNGQVLEGQSGTNYTFLLCSINEVTLTEIGLYYDQENRTVQRKEDVDLHVLKAPMDGFLYPCYCDRAADVSHVLYYTKTPKRPNELLIENILGAQTALPYDKEEAGFKKMLADTAAEDLNLKLISNIFGSLRDGISEAEEAGTSLTLNKEQTRTLLEQAGLSQQKLDRLASVWDHAIGEAELNAVNCMDASRLSMKLPDISVTVKGDAAAKVKTQVIDGRRCLVIEMDDTLEVNGMDVSR